MDETLYNIMAVVANSHRVLTTQIPYESLADEKSRLIMAQEMAKLGLMIDLYAPQDNEEPRRKNIFTKAVDAITK